MQVRSISGEARESVGNNNQCGAFLIRMFIQKTSSPGNNLKEQEIRPKKLLERYLKLCEKDAEYCFSGFERRQIPCVACGSTHTNFEFEKNSFSYRQCRDCGSLYQSPRPVIEAFEKFYHDSESAKFWANEFFPAVAEIRREKIFRPRVIYLAELCKKHGIEVDRIIDVGAGYGLFLDEWRALFPANELIAIEPSTQLAAECRRKGFTVIEALAENTPNVHNLGDLTVCFEVLEHIDEPLKFIDALKRMTRDGGYVIISTLCIDGFDLQVLWNQSSQISPPHHINFLSIKGLKHLFERAQFANTKIITPGKLDVDIVKNAAASDPSLLAGQRFLRHVLDNESLAQRFQMFLSDNSLSSHAWVLAQKPL